MRPSERSHFAGHGGGEQKRLPLFWQPGHHPAQLRGKAHVQHPVRFVEDQNLDGVQPRRPGVEVVNQASRRGDEQRTALAKGAALSVHADSTNDDGGPHVCLPAEKVDMLGNLQGQLARWCQHQRPGARLAVEPLQQGKQVGGGLSGPRGGAADDVAALERRGDGLGLDGSGRSEASGRQRLKRRRGEAEGCEI